MTAPTLAAWLLEQIAADEDAARDAAGWNAEGTERAPGEWSRDGLNGLVDEAGRVVVYGDGPAPNDAQADHIARHDPARVLAECEAKRAIVEHHIRVRDSVKGATPAERPFALAASHQTATVVEMMVQIYADRPGFRDEWRP